jgi:hypothetical protein
VYDLTQKNVSVTSFGAVPITSQTGEVKVAAWSWKPPPTSPKTSR